MSKSKLLAHLLTLALVIAMLFLISGCEGESVDNGEEPVPDEQAVEEPVEGGDLIVALDANPPTMDPTMSTSLATRFVTKPVFESLLALDGNYQIQPMLAESFDISDDGTIYTIKLREGVLFHNGKEMTAEDVLASIDLWMELLTPAQQKLGDAVIESPDTYTILITLDEPLLDLIYDLADRQFRVMPIEIIEARDETGIQEYIGTGPFKFVEWREDQYIHLTKFEEYVPIDLPASGFAGKKEALVDDLYMHIVPDSATRLAGIQAGDYDIALRLPTDSFDLIDNNPDIESITALNAIYLVIFNKKEGLFTDPLMRQAVNAALDAESIMMAAFGQPEFYRLNSSYMWKEQADWYSEAGSEHYNQNDPDKAKRLLDEAGYAGEEIRLMSTRDYAHYYDGGLVVQQQLEEIGLNIKLEIYDWPTVTSLRNEPGEWEILMGGTSFRITPTSQLILNPNWAGWTDSPEIAEGLEMISKAPSIEEASKIWDEVQEECWNYLPAVKTGDFYVLAANRTVVQGFEMFNASPVVWNTSVER